MSRADRPAPDQARARRKYRPIAASYDRFISGAAGRVVGFDALRARAVGKLDLFLYAPLPYRISGLTIGIWLAIAMLCAALATDAAATRASRITVREALAYL